MPGLGVGDHQVARHPVAVHRHGRLRQRAVDQCAADLLPASRLGSAPGNAEFALHAPLGKQRQLACQQRFVVGRQGHCRHLQLPLQQRGDGVAHQPVGLRRAGRLQRAEVQLGTQVAEQQEALLRIVFQHLRPVQPGIADELRHLHERAHVFLRRRCVHDDAAALCRFDAQVAPEAGIGRCRRQRVGPQAVPGGDRLQPAFEGRAALRIGPGHRFAGQLGGQGHGIKARG